MASSPLREILAKFGFEFEGDKLKSAGKQVDGFAKNVTKLSEELLGAGLKSALKSVIGDVKEAINEFKIIGLQLGISNHEMQRWQFAAKDSNVDVGALNTGFRLLQKTMTAAASGSKEASQDMTDGSLEMVLSGERATKIFKALGVEVKDSNGKVRDTPDVMKDVGAAIAAIQDPAQRTATAMAIFGRQGGALLPLFNKGAKGIDTMMSTFEELGGGVSDEAIDALGDSGKATRRYDLAVMSLKSTLVTIVGPIFTEQTKKLTAVVTWVNKATKGTNVWRAGLIVLSGALILVKREAILAGIKTALAWAPTIIMFALLVLLVDDLITTIKGGDSVIRKFLEKLFDKQGEKSIVDQIAEDFDDLQKRLDALPGWGDKVGEVFSSIGSTVVKFFVDDLPDAWVFFWKDMNAKANTGGRTFIDFLTGTFDDFIVWLADWADRAVNSIADGLFGGLSKSSKIKDIAKLLTGNLGADKDGILLTSIAERAAEVPATSDPNAIWDAKPGDSYHDPRLGALKGGANAVGTQINTIQQTNHNQVTVNGQGAAGLTNQVRDGVGQALNDNKGAALSALETVVETP